METIGVRRQEGDKGQRDSTNERSRNEGWLGRRRQKVKVNVKETVNN